MPSKNAYETNKYKNKFKSELIKKTY
ncbi:hypothetical protein OIU84_023903 [Salix udensis]|uniref:Uncharacterized protein n=1 Tax=Salix udensis TaxID=889485 RepID=A0AAD6KU91_9ROSI|nr:hypothetical protein OIU84_023903 [Salix udensis]